MLVGTLTKAEDSGTSHEEIVEKCGELLCSLGHMRTLFPRKDLSRVQALRALLKVGNSKDIQSGLLEEIEHMDYRAELPEGDPRYSSYFDSLIAYFERNRKVRQDLLSAIALGTFDASKPVPTLPSLASVPDGGSQKCGQGQGGTRGGGNERGG